MHQVSISSFLRRLSWLRFALVLGACLGLLAEASAGEGLAATSPRPAVRAAQMFATSDRGGGWASVSPRTTQDERAEIRAHFAAVGRIIIDETPVSLDIAVARFEDSYQLSLSPESRTELRDRLAARRAVQLDRLRSYALAGTFPLNRHYAGEARPIFVDARGTHCAVGHLMAMDGWEADVQAIARTKPNVLVREVGDGPLVSWVLTSGLTQEEAALIQPAYFPPATGDATKLSDLVVPGASVERNGFRYENFAFSASSTGGAATPTADQLGLVYGWPEIGPGFCPGPDCHPRPDTLWFGAYKSPSAFGYIYAGANQSITIDIDYDVVALAAGLAIGGTTTFADSYFGGFLPQSNAGTATLSTTFDGDTLGMLVLEFSLYDFEREEGTLFAAPGAQAHLHHKVQFANGTYFGSFDSVLSATAVPLPGSAGLLGLSLAFIGRYVHRPGKKARS